MDAINAAAEAVAAHQIATGTQGEPMENAIADLLTDLRHYCAETQIRFEDAVFASGIRFEAESID